MKQKMTLYVVDDNEDYLEVIQEKMEASGISVMAFSNGTDLFQQLEKAIEYPTAILLDYVLNPKMSGIKVFQKLSKLYPRIPIIIYSGKDRQGVSEAFGSGAYASLIKPVDFNELEAIIREIRNRNELFSTMAADVLELTGFDCSMVWQLHKESFSYKIVGWAGIVDRDYRQKISFDHDEVYWIERLRNGKTYYCQDVLNLKNDLYLKRAEAAKRNWRTLITIPLVRNGKVLGWIDCYACVENKIPNKKERRNLQAYLAKFAAQASETLRSDALTSQLRLLQEITQKLTITSSEKELFEIIISKAKEYLGAKQGWIYKRDIINDKLVLAQVSAGSEPEKMPPKEIPLGIGLIGGVAKTGQLEYRKDESIYSEEAEILDSSIKSQIAVPIKRAEQHVLGVITMMSPRQDFFNADDIQLLQSLAASTAVVIDQVELNIHLQEISRMAQETASDKELIQYVVEAARKLTFADVTFWELSQMEGEGDNWMRIAGYSGKFTEAFIQNSKVPNDPSKSANGIALNAGKTVILEDLDNLKKGEKFYHQEAIPTHTWKSFMAVPLLGNAREQLGVISLYSRELKAFTREGSRLIEHFARQTALILQKQLHMVALQKLSRIGEDLNIGLPRTKELLQKVADIARQISKADLTVLYPYDINQKDFFDKDSIVYSGEFRTQIKEITAKPKPDGMAAITRKYGVIIVEEVKGKESTIRIGLGELQKHATEQDKQIIISGIEQSGFIKGENIGSFISISLRAGKELRYDNNPLEVGVLYFNYRAPQRFNSDELRVIEVFARTTEMFIFRNRLFDQAQRQRSLMEAINNAGLNILEEQNRHKQLKGIIREAVKLLQASGGKIYLTVNGSQQDARLEAGYHLPKGVKKGIIVPNGHGMVGQVILAKKPQWHNDYSNYPHRIPALENSFSAVIEVPLLHKGEVIGVLSVFDDQQKRQFNAEDATVLEKLAAQAALAIYNLQLREELETLYQFGLQVSAQIDIKQTARIILSGLKKVIDFDKATIQLIRDERMPRETLAREGYNAKTYNEQLTRSVESDPLIKSIIERKTPRILPDTHVVKAWDKDFLETKDVRSWVGIPLIYGDKVFGLITLDHRQPGFYQIKDEARLKRFGSQAAIAIQNALLFEQVNQQQDAQERAIKEITESIANSSDSKALYDRLAEAATALFPKAHRTEIYLRDTKGNSFNRVAAQGDEKKLTDKNTSFSISEGLVGKVFRDGKAILVEDVDLISDYKKVHQDTRSEIVAPIRLGEVIGVLNIEHPEKGGLSIKDKALAEALANLVAITKNKADLLRWFQWLDAFLKTINQIAALEESAGMGEIFTILAEAALAINPEHTTGCHFYMLEQDFFPLTEVKNKLGKKGNLIRYSTFLIGQGLPGWVVQEGQALLIADTKEDYRVDGKEKAKALVLSPLWSGGQIVGVLALQSNQVNAFNAQELSLLEALTLLAESTIYKFEQYRKKARAFQRKYNPYIVGPAITEPKNFYGRTELIESLLNSLHHNHYFLQGERRIGKTSLLLHILYRLENIKDEEYVFYPFYYDLQGVAQNEFFLKFIRRLIQYYLLPLSIRRMPYNHEDFQDDLVKILDIFEEREIQRSTHQEKPKRKIRLVALIDEIQKFDEYESIIPEQLRRVLIDEERLRLVMSGVSFFKQEEGLTSPFNLHLTTNIKGLTEKEARELIVEPVQMIYTYQDEAVEAILNCSNLEPMRIQDICHKALSHMLSRQTKKKKPELIITTIDVDFAITQINTRK